MENLIKLYKEKFGVEPLIIGMYWNNTEQLVINLLEAIEDNKPYNEYNLLTKEERIAFNSGKLLF